MFGSSGYHATSMEDIAEAAGVTKPVLYQHFPSKRALYLELVRTVGEELVSTISDRAAAEADPYHRVLEGFRAYFRFVRRNTAAFQLLFGGGARQADELDEAVAGVEGAVARAIGDLIDVDIDDEHRSLLGFAIVGLAEVTSRQWVQQGGVLDEPAGERRAERLANLVWAGLRALPSANR